MQALYVYRSRLSFNPTRMMKEEHPHQLPPKILVVIPTANQRCLRRELLILSLYWKLMNISTTVVRIKTFLFLLQSRTLLLLKGMISRQLLLESKEGENSKCQFMRHLKKNDAEELAEAAANVYHLEILRINCYVALIIMRDQNVLSGWDPNAQRPFIATSAEYAQ